MKPMSLLGIQMQCLSYEEMHTIFDRWLAERTPASRSKALALINVHSCVSCLLDRRLRELYNAVDLAGIDSMPFLFLARAFHQRDSDRFYAPDLLLEVSGRSVKKGYTFFLYGGYPGSPETIADGLHARFPGIKITGTYSPPFRELTAAEDAEVCERINAAHPDFLWVGLGSPKQDEWIAAHRDNIYGSILIPSGATFDFFGGRIRQAPAWIRNIGFEWLFRLTQDFRRLWRRYTIYNAVFIVAFVLEQLRVLTFDSHGTLRILGRETRLGNV